MVVGRLPRLWMIVCVWQWRNKLFLQGWVEIVLCFCNFLCEHPRSSQKHRSRTWHSGQHWVPLPAPCWHTGAPRQPGAVQSCGDVVSRCQVWVRACSQLLCCRHSQSGSISKILGLTGRKRLAHPSGMGFVFVSPAAPTTSQLCLLSPLWKYQNEENAQIPGVHGQVAKRAKPGLLLLTHCDLVAPREQPWAPSCKIWKFV